MKNEWTQLYDENERLKKDYHDLELMTNTQQELTFSIICKFKSKHLAETELNNIFTDKEIKFMRNI